MMKSKLTMVAVVVLLTGWVIGLGCYPFVIWSSLNCRHEDLDINTGRIRHQRFLGGICISEYITDSPISRALNDKGTIPSWRRVNTFSPCVGYSPHYRFHSGINQTRRLEFLWQLATFTPDAKRAVSREILQLWQTGQSADTANTFLDTVSALAIDSHADALSIDTSDLPTSAL